MKKRWAQLGRDWGQQARKGWWFEVCTPCPSFPPGHQAILSPARSGVGGGGQKKPSPQGPREDGGYWAGPPLLADRPVFLDLAVELLPLHGAFEHPQIRGPNFSLHSRALSFFSDHLCLQSSPRGCILSHWRGQELGRVWSGLALIP